MALVLTIGHVPGRDVLASIGDHRRRRRGSGRCLERAPPDAQEERRIASRQKAEEQKKRKQDQADEDEDDDILKDSFFANPGRGGVGAAAAESTAQEKQLDRQGGMDLDELMDDSQTMDGKRTLNEADRSTTNDFKAPKIPDRDRMISTAHDGGAGRGFRRRRVSTNYREMRESIDQNKPKPIV